MAIDLRKNKDALLKAYQDVVADNNSTDWAVFCYEGQTPVLKVAETGEGGISEMVEALNSSKIMYAYCKVMDPNTNLPKYVLINWQGEATSESMKFKCANHLQDVHNFFHGIHVSINARTEADVDEDDILKKVAKSSGSQYSIHKEKPKAQEPIAPVGSVYQKTQATSDISQKERDKFWAKTETEEHRRLEEEKKNQLLVQQALEAEHKEREAREQKERERRIAEKTKELNEQKAAEKKASQLDKDQKQQWDREQEQAYKDEEERKLRAENAQKERAAEAERLAQNQASNARSFFQNKTSGAHQNQEPINKGPPPPRKLKHEFETVGQHEPAVSKEPVHITKRQPSPTVQEIVREPSPAPREPSPPRRQPSPPHLEPSSAPTPASRIPMPETRNLLGETLPQHQTDSDGEQNSDWAEDAGTADIPPSSVHHIPDHVEEPAEEPAEEPEEPQGKPTGSNLGLCVKALYDYQASDETEISFDPHDVITNVEQIDDGWWVGVGPNGSKGMFPANFVEVIE